MKRIHALLGLLGIMLVLAVVFRSRLDAAVSIAQRAARGQQTIESRLKEFGKAARGRLQPSFAKAKVPYPPARVTFVGIKDENRLEIYAAGPKQTLRYITAYPVLAASGVAGPKQREGDGQVPEGLYEITALNPNSSYHVSMRVSYPNAFDREQARQDRRTELGGDIIIHGSAVSIGCLAMGDPASEDLFTLAADTGLKNISVILTPVDFRLGKAVPGAAALPAWTKTLYAQIKAQLQPLPAAPRP